MPVFDVVFIKQTANIHLFFIFLESVKELENQISIRNKSIETLTEENKTALKSLQEMKEDLNRAQSKLELEKVIFLNFI